jgi:hypothetical protein
MKLRFPVPRLARVAFGAAALALLGGCALTTPLKPAFDPFELVRQPGIYNNCGKGSCTPVVGANISVDVAVKGELPRPPRGLLFCPVTPETTRCDANGVCTVSCKATLVVD